MMGTALSLELKRHDWSLLRASGSASAVPLAIQRLSNAASDAVAGEAYWEIDNCVIVQGRLFAAALPSAICLVLALFGANAISRKHILELLRQIADGFPDESEISLGNADLAFRCAKEVSRAFPLFMNLLDSHDSDEVEFAIDLIGFSAKTDDGLKKRVIYILKNNADTLKHPSLKELIRNWLVALQSEEI